MSNHVSERTWRNAAAIAVLVVASSALAGCSTMGMTGQDSITTGSTLTSAGGNMNQPMPQPIVVADNGAGKYIPPENIGGTGPGSFWANDGAVTRAPMPGSAQGVVSHDLPTLNSSPVAGSNQTMPAQLSTPTRQPAAPSFNTASHAGFTHVVESGESLHSIARTYGVSGSSIVNANALSSADKIYVGQKLIIPGAVTAPKTTTASHTLVAATGQAPEPVSPALRPEAAPAPVKVASTPKSDPAPAQTTETRVASVAPVKATPPAAPASQDTGGTFRWPVSGKVVVDFAASKGTGINISVPEGTPVRAADAGTVIYTGNAIEGFGNLVLIKHPNGYVSAYAHLAQITVAKGDGVTRGEAIGAAGMTGSVSRPQLHFELRKGATAVDPMPLLAG